MPENWGSLNLKWFRSVPVILQSETAECGLACVAMLARYHGFDTTLRSLRRAMRVSTRGTTLKTIMEAAELVGLESRALRIELEDLANIRVPAILHWEMSHFVVVTKVSGSGLVIHDPAIGSRRIRWSEATHKFTGVVLEVDKGVPPTPLPTAPRLSLRKLLGMARGLTRSVAYIVILALACELLSLAFPLFLQIATDKVLKAHSYSLLTTLGLAFSALVVINAVVTFMRSWAVLYFGTTLNVQWMSKAFDHLLRLPLTFFEARHVGDLLSKLDAIPAIQAALSSQVMDSVIDGMMASIMLGVMFWYSSALSFIACLFLIMYITLRLGLYPILHKSVREYLQHSAKQHTFAIETLYSVRAVKVFGRTTARGTDWTGHLITALNAKLTGDKISIVMKTGQTLLNGLQSVMTIWYGVVLVERGRMSLGMLFAFLAFKEQVTGRVVVLVDRLVDLSLVGVQVDRLSDILGEQPESIQREMSRPAVSRSGEVSVSSLYYRYSNAEDWLFADFSLMVEPGECIAITGASGQGKSTLVKLIAGLLQPCSGEVSVSGISVRKNRHHASQIVGLVLQDDTLLSGTVAENVHFFDDEPDMARVIECCMMCGIHTDIDSMPMGYNSLIVESGRNVSGGQKQRILIARALYRRPSILILDEATSHLDLHTERAVAATLKQLQLTRILVAHRPHTIAIADRVVELTATSRTTLARNGLSEFPQVPSLIC